jgi:predicted PurR-regulated permease PerM
VVVAALYVALVTAIVGLTWLSTPRLLSELGRLTREIPGMLASARQSLVPEIDRRIRALTAPYLPPPAPAAGAAPRTAPEPPRSTLDVEARPGGGYALVLPPGGVRVVRESDHSFRIEPASARAGERPDLSTTIKESVARMARDTEHTTLAVLRLGQAFVQGLVRGVFGFALMLMMSAYLLLTRDQIFGFARTLYAPTRRGDFDDLMRRIDRGLSGVVRGQLIICGVNGVLSGLGFYLLGLPYWVFLTLIATVMSIIPIFGAILSSVPAVLVALPLGPGTALLTLGWIIVIHQIEANVLNPKILGDSARVHPVLVIFALLAGEHLAGVIGALLAVPTLSIVQTLFLYLRESYLGVPRASMLPPAPAPAPAPPAQAPPT